MVATSTSAVASAGSSVNENSHPIMIWDSRTGKSYPAENTYVGPTTHPISYTENMCAWVWANGEPYILDNKPTIAPAGCGAYPINMPDNLRPVLTWKQGDPYPVVNGTTAYIPPVDVASTSQTPSTTGRERAGSLYDPSATTYNATLVSMAIKTPSSTPSASQSYFVLLSVCDDGPSYDQIGFSAYNGVWGLTYSWTSGSPLSNPNLVYHCKADEKNLTTGTVYIFEMTISGGTVVFNVYQNPASPTKIWTASATTGGSYFKIQSNYSGVKDYQNYEEIIQLYPPSPPPNPAFDFYFYHNYWLTNGSGYIPSWNSYLENTPSNIGVMINQNNVFVSNIGQDFGFSITPLFGGSVKAGGTATVNIATSAFNGFSGSVNIIVGYPGGYGLSFALSNYITLPSTPTSTLYVYTSSSTPKGTYMITVFGQNSSGTISHNCDWYLVVT
jgi:hypothetical protein